MSSIDLRDLLKKTETRDDLVTFIRVLKTDYEKGSQKWANDNLGSFLEALAAWTHDMDGYYKNQGIATPQAPSWKTFADMLMAATMYE